MSPATSASISETRSPAPESSMNIARSSSVARVREDRRDLTSAGHVGLTVAGADPADRRHHVRPLERSLAIPGATGADANRTDAVAREW